MNRTVELLQHGPQLIMSLPANDPELARAAQYGGADVLKVHLRVHHAASGSSFGTLDDERANLQQILALFSGPVGIVAGAEDPATPQEMDELCAMGIDFFDLYAAHMPAWMWRISAMSKVVALEAGEPVQRAMALEHLGADLLEAAIIPHDGYGKALTVADLAAYRHLHDAVDLPIIVPTQRAIQPAEASLITGECGIEGLMIGVIVTGNTPRGIEDAVKRYKAALTA